MNLKCLFGHKWSGCKCERCDAIRDEGHKWILLEGKCTEKCSVCDKERNIEHKWNDGKCERCGATKDDRIIRDSKNTFRCPYCAQM